MFKATAPWACDVDLPRPYPSSLPSKGCPDPSGRGCLCTVSRLRGTGVNGHVRRKAIGISDVAVKMNMLLTDGAAFPILLVMTISSPRRYVCGSEEEEFST